MAKEIIQKVRSGIEGRDEVIRSLYGDVAIDRAVMGTLVNMGCDRDLAKDAKTDAIVSFIKACYRPDFEIKSNVTNYLIGAAKNIWLSRVTKYKKEHTTEEIHNLTSETDTEESIENNLISDEKKQLLKQLIDRLDDTCKKVLTLWSINKRMKEIAASMQYKSEGMARKKKHQCLKRLYTIVHENPGISNDLRSIM